MEVQQVPVCQPFHVGCETRVEQVALISFITLICVHKSLSMPTLLKSVIIQHITFTTTLRRPYITSNCLENDHYNEVHSVLSITIIIRYAFYNSTYT